MHAVMLTAWHAHHCCLIEAYAPYDGMQVSTEMKTKLNIERRNKLTLLYPRNVDLASSLVRSQAHAVLHQPARFSMILMS